MIRRWLPIVAFALSLTPAQSFAAVLPMDVQVQFLIHNLPPVTFAGAGTGTSVGGGILTLPSDFFAGNPALDAPISPTLVGLTHVTVPASSIGNPVGSFAPHGAMGLSGAIFFNGGALAIPLAPIGGGGNAAVNLGFAPGTLQGATWMGGTAVFTSMEVFFGIPVSLRATSYDNRTPGGQGSIQLVAPARVSTPFGSFPARGILTVVPEPATLTFLGAGVVALALIGRRKLEERG